MSVNEQQLAAFARIEAELLDLPGAQWDPPSLRHLFAPGVYIREIVMHAGSYVLGAQHRTEHFNVVLQGRADVFSDGAWHTVTAPCTFASGVDVRKFLLVHEDMLWQTVHANPDNETDIKKLEERLFIYTPHYLRKRAERDSAQHT